MYINVSNAEDEISHVEIVNKCDKKYCKLYDRKYFIKRNQNSITNWHKVN